jgi:PKD repeat protein
VSEEKAKAGGLKGIVGTLVGLLSGGAVMYLSPLVDRVIKPQKPVANFAVEADGLQVTLHNRSAGGDGWWDFGDGAALEPATSATDTITHAYAKPGTYTVKLMLRNFIGDDADRTVQVDVGGQSTAATPPAILRLEATPVSAQSIAPATFRLIGTAQNAELAVWDVDENLEIVKDSPNSQDKTVTFDKPGKHVIQYAVVNGSTTQKKIVTVDVRPAPANTLLAVLSVADSGTRVERKTYTEPVALVPDAAAKPFEKTLTPHHGFHVVEAKLTGKEPAGVRNVTIQPNADRSSVKVSGELLPATTKPGQKGVGVPVLMVAMTVEKQSAETRKPTGNTMPIVIGGTTTIPLASLPQEWTGAKRQATLELKYGTQSILPAVPLPYKAPLKVGAKTYLLKAALVEDRVQIDVHE